MQVLLPAVLNPSGLLSVLSGRPARTFGTVLYTLSARQWQLLEILRVQYQILYAIEL